MTITWYGQSCFKVETREAILAIDPFSKDIGLTPPRFHADLALVSHQHHDHNNVSAITLRSAKESSENSDPKELAVIAGPGEYEIGGIKIRGYRNGMHSTYSLTVDGIDILIGTIEALEKTQQKLKEHHILVAATNVVIDSSFVTSLASNVVLFYGEKGSEAVKGFASEAVKTLGKYQVTKDKLPQEMETVLLA